MAITTAVDAVYEVERQLIRQGFTPGGGKAGPAKWADGRSALEENRFDKVFHVQLEAWLPEGNGRAAYDVSGIVDAAGLRAPLVITRRADWREHDANTTLEVIRDWLSHDGYEVERLHASPTADPMKGLYVEGDLRVGGQTYALSGVWDNNGWAMEPSIVAHGDWVGTAFEGLI